ncbi:NAD(P)H-hydrate epimerase [Candidatus Woesearchaeota archaeon]|nr:NAD(P)H-hydrate epimerase [Candidatus Woesearchaeota archaeon]
MITSDEMRKLEDNCGIDKIELMEHAGREVYEVLKNKFALKNKKILIAAYHGNNGGDGFVAARYLCENAGVDVLFLGDEIKLKKEALLNYKKIINNPKIQFPDVGDVDFDDYDIIIDAILGIGIEGSLRKDILNTVGSINNSKAFKVAVDVPTGLNPDSGEILDKAVDADLIITFHDLKKGLEKYKNKVVIVNIGIKK